jgi:catechol 2,3-dioxygenase-like lactoylglutathione lyase family enzyme
MEHIIDHMSVNVRDFDKSKNFYMKALAPLGITLAMEYKHFAGFGRGGKPEFWTSAGPTDFQKEEHLRFITPGHVCFAAQSRAEVDAFYRAALEAGGRDNGAPGIRAHYHANYYGAFVIDPDGHNIEAVFHG